MCSSVFSDLGTVMNKQGSSRERIRSLFVTKEVSDPWPWPYCRCRSTMVFTQCCTQSVQHESPPSPTVWHCGCAMNFPDMDIRHSFVSHCAGTPPAPLAIPLEGRPWFQGCQRRRRRQRSLRVSVLRMPPFLKLPTSPTSTRPPATTTLPLLDH